MCASTHTAPAGAATLGGLELWVDLRQFDETDGDWDSSSLLSFLGGDRREEVDAALLSEEQASDEMLQKSLASLPTSQFIIAKTIQANNVGGSGATQKPIPNPIYRDDGDGQQPLGAMVDVSTSAGQDAAVGLIGSLEWIVITCSNNHKETESVANDSGDDEGWLMIPAENLISACQGTGTKLAATVQKVGDVGGLVDALQLGVDALCIDIAGVNDEKIWAACLDAKKKKSLAARAKMGENKSPTSGPRIVQGSCRRLATPSGKSTVLADRVCIDFLQSLKPTEGCWLGSSAKMMALILSEAAQSSFVPSRPFRVNAGPVHSYVLMGDGVSTKYLSELRAADEVLVFDTETETERAVAVGRLKEEVRPCIQIELAVDFGTEQECAGAEPRNAITRGQIFVQQAETVRMGKRRGEATFVRATDLEIGTENDAAARIEILVRVTALGTHVGKTYSGKVQEK